MQRHRAFVYRVSLMLLPISLVLLSPLGCSEPGSDDWTPVVYPIFDPMNAIIPAPNVLLIDQETGMVKIPMDDLTPTETEYVGGFMNTLDGFPLNSPLTCLFDTPAIDPATVNGDNVQVYDVTAVFEAIDAGETPGADAAQRLPAEAFISLLGESVHAVTGAPIVSLSMFPKRPYESGHRYAALVTKGVTTADGTALGSSFMFNLIKSTAPLVDEDGIRTVLQASITDADAAQLEPARAFNDAVLTVLAGQDSPVAREDVVLMWGFHTHTASVAEFDPVTSTIPMPNDILMGADGTLDVPTPEGAAPAFVALNEWMNELDGFGRAAPAVISLTRPAVQETLVLKTVAEPAGTVAVFDITDLSNTFLVEDAIVTAMPDGKVSIIPPGMWERGHRYLAAMTRGVVTTDGEAEYPLLPAATSALAFLDGKLFADDTSQVPMFLTDSDASQLEALRSEGVLARALLTTVGIEKDDLAALFAFTIMSPGESLYDPTTGAIPLPNDLLMGPDGTLDFPIAPGVAPAEAALFEWMNTLDGFSHTQAGSVGFTVPLDHTTVPGAFMFVKLTGDSGVPTQALMASAEEGSMDVTITPTEVLAEGGRYVVIVTHDLKDAEGNAYVEANLIRLLKSEHPLADEAGKTLLPGVIDDATAAMLEPNRLAFAGLFDQLAALGKTRDDVLTFWSFSTHTGAEALFDPTTGTIPFPNDLVLQFDEVSGLPIGIDLPAPEGASEVMLGLLAQLSKLDGFSTLGATTAPLSVPLTQDSLVPFAGSGSIIDHLGDFETLTLAVADITPVVLAPESTEALAQVRVLGTDEVTILSSDAGVTVMPKPGFPFEGNHTYMVAILEGADTADATGLEPSPVFVMARSATPLVNDLGQSYVSLLDDATAALLEMLRQQYQPMFDAFAGGLIGVPREQVKIFWTYTTQSIAAPLIALRAALAGAPLSAAAKHIDGVVLKKDNVGGEIPGWDLVQKSNIAVVVRDAWFEGHLLLGDPDFSDAAAPKLAAWQFDEARAPVWNTNEAHLALKVPFVMALPEGAPPAEGWPLVLFQHGMGRDKHDVWPLADAFAAEGYAVLALDAVWHGARAVPGMEAEAGSLFMYPDPFVVRDHYRQTALDQMELARLLRSGDLEAFLKANDGQNTLTGFGELFSGDIFYLGHSLGAQVGVAFASVEEDVKAIVLNAPGAHITRMLSLSENPGFRAIVEQVYALAGVTEGSAEGDELLATMQWALDAADPINFAQHLCAKPVPEHSALPVFVQLADKDEFIATEITDELLLALGRGGCDDGAGGSLLAQDSYANSCHAFLVGCDAAFPSDATTALEQVRAREDVVTFFNAQR